MSDYKTQLKLANKVPKFYFGQEVETPLGKGIIVNIHASHNGLYISWESASANVWFSTLEAKGGFVNSTFKLSELKSIGSKEQKLANEKEKKSAEAWNDFREGAYRQEMEKMVICKCDKPDAWFTALNTCRNCNGEIYSDLKRSRRYFIKP